MRSSWAMLLLTHPAAIHETHSRALPRRLLPLSRLRRIVPGMGTFFMSLHLVQAFKEYDAVFSISKCVYLLACLDA